jgi:cobalt-zinc-cadmium efflux system outer membrane protein
MLPGLLRWLALPVVGLFLAGCLYPVREQTDQIACDLATHTLDLEPAPPADVQQALPPTMAWDAGAAEAAQPKDKKAPQPPNLLVVPSDLPGAEAPPIEIGKNWTPAQIQDYYAKLYPPLPPIGSEVQPLPGPNGNPLTLSDLQRIALSTHPEIVRAVADVKAAEGAALQAGLHPNPSFGYVSDTVGTAGTAGFQGVFLEQTIRTAGKLDLAREVALADVVNSQIALRSTRNDVATRVRASYFAVLVAQENIKVNRALVRFAEGVYRYQLEQLRTGGLVAAYEPMQLRVLVLTARSALVQSRNAYLTAWKQLASAVGQPGLPPMQLAGKVDFRVPLFEYDQILARILTSHTDVLTAENTIRRARLNLRLAQITPIPDIDLQLKLEKDYTAPPHLLTNSIQLTVPVPIFDRNQGNIQQAQAQLVRAQEGPHFARLDLTSRLAEAFGRYQTFRTQLEYYRTTILPDQVRAYRNLFDRYQVERAATAPTFQDIVNAQQLLATTIQTYLTVLGSMWTAVVDVANLLQTEDLFQVKEHLDIAPVPDLPPLPCRHPCSPLQDSSLLGADPRWPAAAPGRAGNSLPAPEKIPPPAEVPAEPDK